MMNGIDLTTNEGRYLYTDSSHAVYRDDLIVMVNSFVRGFSKEYEIDGVAVTFVSTQSPSYERSDLTKRKLEEDKSMNNTNESLIPSSLSPSSTPSYVPSTQMNIIVEGRMPQGMNFEKSIHQHFEQSWPVFTAEIIDIVPSIFSVSMQILEVDNASMTQSPLPSVSHSPTNRESTAKAVIGAVGAAAAAGSAAAASSASASSAAASSSAAGSSSAAASSSSAAGGAGSASASSSGAGTGSARTAVGDGTVFDTSKLDDNTSGADASSSSATGGAVSAGSSSAAASSSSAAGGAGSASTSGSGAGTGSSPTASSGDTGGDNISSSDDTALDSSKSDDKDANVSDDEDESETDEYNRSHQKHTKSSKRSDRLNKLTIAEGGLEDGATESSGRWLRCKIDNSSARRSLLMVCIYLSCLECTVYALSQFLFAINERLFS